MKLADLNRLTTKELKRLTRYNSIAYHSFMTASVVLMVRAFSEINPLILLISFGLVISARAFHANMRALKSLRHARQQS